MNSTNIFKPILFNTEMVQAILAGRKTQTRRIINYPISNNAILHGEGSQTLWNKELRVWVVGNCEDYIVQNESFFIDKRLKRDSGIDPKKWYECIHEIDRKYKIDNILWVRETWQTTFNEKSKEWDPIYKTDGKYWIDDDGAMKWKPSIHMPKKHARIFLKVTKVRCERLQDISEEDAIAEGVIQHSDYGSTGYVDYENRDTAVTDIDAVWSFETLWQSINAKKHPWDSNPWVWVYDFERIEKPENFI